jgi:cation diffusion facilitator family transporter
VQPNGHASPHFASRRSAALVSLGVGLLMLAGKWAAYVLTGSHAILSDALESIVHVAATGFAYASILLSARPPDPKYPYGYGKVTYFSAGFEGGMITLAALAILYEAGQGFFRGEELQQLDKGLALILLASVVNLALGLMLIRQGRRTESLILVADGQHVLTDSYTSFGVVLGVALVYATGWTWLDPTVAVLVGLNILRTGYDLVRAGVTGLMDRSDPALLGKIVEALQASRQPGWIDVHHLRAWQAGDRTFVDFHLVVPEDWTVGQLHEANDRCLDILRRTLGEATEMNIHFDPDLPEVRGFDARRPWAVTSAVRIPGPGDLGAEVPANASALAPTGRA